MKVLASFALISMASIYSWSLNAAPVSHNPKILLQKETSGGYVPEEYQGWLEGTKVYSNGQMVHYKRKNHRSPLKTTHLGYLSASSLENLKNRIQSIGSGDVVFPDEPQCMDLPETSYISPAFSKAIAQVERCLTGYPAEGQHIAQQIKNFLDSLEVLTKQENTL